MSAGDVPIELSQLTEAIADALLAVDQSGVPFKQYRPGVGPYGEPQLVALVARHLREIDIFGPQTRTRRQPDLLIPDRWALEFKLVRPFGDNGLQAENWSVNLLYPYPGNVSAIGDCLKLKDYAGPERRASVVIGYEHTPPQIPLEPLLASFELIAPKICGINLGHRTEVRRTGLKHPHHQQLLVAAWEVL